MTFDDENLKKLRKKIFLTAYSGNTGHLASSFSITELLYVLYCKQILNYDVNNPEWSERDKLVMSKGHASLALYAVLSEVGYFSDNELYQFCRPGSMLGGEPKLGDIPGVEASTGSLGHGLSFGIGIAMANKIQKKSSKVYVILGDGECQEGSIWEGVMAAANFHLDNLVVIMDNNKLQAMGSVKELMGISSWREKWEAFGWNVKEIDGHNLKQIELALREKPKKNKPYLIIAETIKGKGVSFMEQVPIWHFRMPNSEELTVVMRELEISEEELKKCGQLI